MYVEALLGLFAFSAFVFVFYGPWQSVCTDWARQTIFESRDGLFDLATSGELSFEAGNYRTIRSSLNCLIRFAHEVTWVEFLALYAALSNSSDLDRESDLKRSIDGIENDATRVRVTRLVNDAQRAVVLMMAFKSLPLCLVLLATQVSSSIGKKIKPMGIITLTKHPQAVGRAVPQGAGAPGTSLDNQARLPQGGSAPPSLVECIEKLALGDAPHVIDIISGDALRDEFLPLLRQH